MLVVQYSCTENMGNHFPICKGCHGREDMILDCQGHIQRQQRQTILSCVPSSVYLIVFRILLDR